MLKMKNPVGQGQGYETGSGGDSKNRDIKIAKNDIIVKHCRVHAHSLNRMFESVACNLLSLCQGQFLPSRVAQQGGRK